MKPLDDQAKFVRDRVLEHGQMVQRWREDCERYAEDRERELFEEWLASQRARFREEARGEFAAKRPLLDFPKMLRNYLAARTPKDQPNREANIDWNLSRALDTHARLQNEGVIPNE